jgi:hypothetical protein
MVRIVTLAFILLCSLFLLSQTPPRVPLPPLGQTPQEQDPAAVRFEKERLKRANSARHVALQRDTDKLLELAQQLKKHVDGSSENTLSVNVIRTAEEIEKLAKNVKTSQTSPEGTSPCSPPL